MKFKLLSLSAVVLTCATLMIVSCGNLEIGRGRKHKHGPPPHAPAHGYRHKYQGVELVYDSGRGVYIVIGFPHHYHYKGHYYRLHEARWETGVHIDGPWKSVSEAALPPGLRAKEKGKGKSKGHVGRGPGI